MGNGSNSYLYRALVVDKPLAVNANAGYQGTSLERDAVLDLGGAQAGRRFRNRRAGHRQRDRRSFEKSRACRGSGAGSKPSSSRRRSTPQDNQATLARLVMAAGLTTGLSIEDIRSWPEPDFARVTAEQVRAGRAKKWLDKKRSVHRLS